MNKKKENILNISVIDYDFPDDKRKGGVDMFGNYIPTWWEKNRGCVIGFIIGACIGLLFMLLLEAKP